MITLTGDLQYAAALCEQVYRRDALSPSIDLKVPAWPACLLKALAASGKAISASDRLPS